MTGTSTSNESKFRDTYWVFEVPGLEMLDLGRKLAYGKRQSERLK